VERHFLRFEDRRRKNGWSEISKKISRGSEDRQISEKYRGDTVTYSLRLMLRRGRAVDPESQGSLDLHVRSCIRSSWRKGQRIDDENCEVARRDIPMPTLEVWDHRR
jgi:hypothetical protein